MWPTLIILTIIIVMASLLHATAVDGWNNGIEIWTDPYTNIPEGAVMWLVGAGGIFLIGGAFDWYSPLTAFGGLVGLWEGILGTWGMTSIRYTSRDKSNDKPPFLEWITDKNEKILVRSLKSHDNEVTKEAWRKGFSNLANNSLIEDNFDFPKFSDQINHGDFYTMSREERYHLALLRIHGLWDDATKTESYARWLDWDAADIETHRKEDGDISTNLARYIESQTVADLRNGLGRVMDEEEVLRYLPSLVDSPEFWLKREVTVKSNEPGSEEEKEESFLQWIDHVMRSPGAHYLVSEAAKGKSTTLNLLTLHHVNFKSGIWPLRVKLRELYSETSNQPLLSRVSDFYKAHAGKEFEYVRDRFDAVTDLDGDGDTPLLILDGLDELTRKNQTELLAELKKESWSIPILVVTRPFNRILDRDHAVLGKMTGQQRVEVLRNLDLDPRVLRQMENLPDVLIDRPFALLIAAEKIRGGQTSSLDDGDINLSLSEISKMYEENYFEREREKKPDLEELGDTHGYIGPIKDTLNHLALHHIRHHAPPEINDPAVQEKRDFVDAAVKLKIIHKDLNLIDGWLTGYYAARSPDFEEEVWNTVLQDVHQNPDSSELIIRYFVASASAEQTPNWDMLGLDAPVVMDIASQEWLAMDRSSRKSMMTRFGIPHGDEGRLEFPPGHDFMECELPELLALLHFHCSIADTEGWHSPEETIDTQWEQLFTALTMRYYDEFKDEINRLENEGTIPREEWETKKDPLYGRKFALGKTLDAYRRQKRAFMEDLFGEGYARGVTRVRKLVPHNHHRDTRRDILVHDVMYFGDAVPSPLLRVIERGLGGSIGELQSLIFAVGMIETHAERPLFKLSRVVLEKFVPSAYEIQGGPWEEARIMLHRIIGYRERRNVKSIRECKRMEFAESGFGIPLEITWDEDYSSYARRFLSDEEFSPLKRIKNQKWNSTYVNDELRTGELWWHRKQLRLHKRADSGVGVLISKNILSTLIIPDYNLDEKLTRQRYSLIGKRTERNKEVKRLKKLRGEKSQELNEIRYSRKGSILNPNSSEATISPLREAEIAQEEAHKLMLKAVREANLAHKLMSRMEEDLELHSSGEDLRQHRMKDLVELLPSCEEQTTILLLMSRWIPPYVLKEKKKPTEIDEWWQYSNHTYKAELPSKDPRLMRTIETAEKDFIIPRLELQWNTPRPDYPYLVCFRGGGFAVDTEPVANVVALNFSMGLLYWIIGKEGRTRSSCVYRQPNKDLAEVYREFMGIDNRRFQPSSVFKDIAKKLVDLRATGKVAVYLKRGSINVMNPLDEHSRRRVLLVPETDWRDRDFTDLTYEIRHQGKLGPPWNMEEIEEAFSSLYSVIPGAPEDAHLNRWYAVDFILGSDDSGERYIFPDHETIEPLCQLCAAVPIEIEGNPKQVFICEGCSEWYLSKPKNEEE